MRTATEMAPVKPFKNSIGALPPDKPKARPTNLGEARALIAEIFVLNDWNDEEAGRYLASLELGGKTLPECTRTDLMIIVADLENSHMLLLAN